MNKLFVANWKRYLSIEESAVLFGECAEIESEHFDIAIAPNHLALYACSHIESPHALAGQDCFYEPAGAYTGIVSPDDLAELGCAYVIVGHSERRTYQGETDEMIAKKVAAAIRAGITPILCVGETRDERNAGRAREVVEQQLGVGLSQIVERENCIIAYEPRWAITGSGEGDAMNPNDVNEMHILIKQITEQACRVIYGGSITPENIREIVDANECDGVLVGSASTNKDSLLRMTAA